MDKNLGTTLNQWKGQWNQRKDLRPQNFTTPLPENNITAAGYIVMQYSAKESRPVQAYLKWANRIPGIFQEFVLNDTSGTVISIDADANCIALLKHFRSLAPMSMEVHKPIFLLKPGDGAIGAHVYAVKASYREFEVLTRKILERCPPTS